MKKLLLFVGLLLSAYVGAQPKTEHWFDFWVGNWEARWTDAKGNEIKGTNRIEKTLDGTVLQEYFTDSSNGFKGTSISVYHKASNTWRQAWADNGGGYFSFAGELEGEKRIFKTDPIQKNGKLQVQRMVFYNLQPDAFTWDWMASEDGGKNWKLLWRIYYRRKPA